MPLIPLHRAIDKYITSAPHWSRLATHPVTESPRQWTFLPAATDPTLSTSQQALAICLATLYGETPPIGTFDAAFDTLDAAEQHRIAKLIHTVALATTDEERCGYEAIDNSDGQF